MLSFNQVSYCYPDSPDQALTKVSFTVAPGEQVVLLGCNGSGKSTLAQLANGLLLPTEGTVQVNNLQTDNRATIRELRSRIGVIAQNPDNQIVSTTVLDEVAFGPENLGVDPAQILASARQALEDMGLAGFEERDPNTLSGGEKQRLIIAGLMAMDPAYLVLDEPTSMLDAVGRQEVHAAINKLHARGHGILHITHHLGFAQDADKAVVLQAGQLVYEGPPRELLDNHELLVSFGLEVPDDDNDAAPQLNPHLLETLRAAITSNRASSRGGESTALRAQDVRYAYGVAAGSGKRGQRREAAAGGGGRAREAAAGGSGAREAVAGGDAREAAAGGGSGREAVAGGTQGEPAREVLRGVNLNIVPGSYTLITGGTGSGKSTLLRILSGLLEPTAGSLAFANGDPVVPSDVGIVFQHPESQLFARSVEEEILFGPDNLGLIVTPEDRRKAVVDALEAVGLDPEDFMPRSPFTLSGGEMRRVAIASILAMRPTFLLLDEPTAGLDALGRAFVHSLIAHLIAAGAGVVVVSHDLDEFTPRAHTHLVLQEGALWLQEDARPQADARPQSDARPQADARPPETASSQEDVSTPQGAPQPGKASSLQGAPQPDETGQAETPQGAPPPGKASNQEDTPWPW